MNILFPQAVLPSGFDYWFFSALFLFPWILIILDLVTGITAAHRTKTFLHRKVSTFFDHDVSRYLKIVLLVVLVSVMSGSDLWTLLCAFVLLGVLCYSMSASITRNLWVIRDSFLPQEVPLPDLPLARDDPPPAEERERVVAPKLSLPSLGAQTAKSASLSTTYKGFLGPSTSAPPIVGGQTGEETLTWNTAPLPIPIDLVIDEQRKPI
jgi:hypothetical protein